MGKYVSLSIPVLLLASAIQASLIPQIRILGGGPDLVFLIVLSWAVNAELDEAVTWAFMGGIMQDLLSAAPIGTSSLSLILMVFVVYIMNKQFYRVGLLSLAILAFLGTFFKETIFAFILALVGLAGNYFTVLSYVIIPSAFYNLAAIGFVYVFIRFFRRRFQRETRVFR